MATLIKRAESTRYPGLFVEKYTKKVFWDNLWNEDPALVESRGVVKDASGKVVIRPFTKIFNRGENGTDLDLDETVLIVSKVNGFMAGATFVESVGGHGQVVVSTTGSLDSEYVDLATEHLPQGVYDYITECYAETKRPCTYLFEIVDSVKDPHIIPERTGAYLIGAREVGNSNPYFSTGFKEGILDRIAEEMGVMRPHWTITRFGHAVEEVKVGKHEGFVVYGQDSEKVLKMKSPYYLTLKAAARIRDISTLNRQRVDEEFYPLIDWLQENAEDFNAMDEQTRLKMVREHVDFYYRQPVA